MPIILVLGLVFPRFVIFVLWLFTNWFVTMSIDWIVALLGFLFMPYTLLWFSVVANFYGGVWGDWQMLFLLLAVLADLWHLSASSQAYSEYSII